MNGRGVSASFRFDTKPARGRAPVTPTLSTPPLGWGVGGGHGRRRHRA
jgi:hypothetical protein